jgi:hypothetical protein
MSAQSACRPIPPPLSLPPLPLSFRCLVIGLGSSHLGQHKKALREELGGLVGASIRQGGSVAPRAICMSANLNVLGPLYVSLSISISHTLFVCVSVSLYECLCQRSALQKRDWHTWDRTRRRCARKRAAWWAAASARAGPCARRAACMSASVSVFSCRTSRTAPGRSTNSCPGRLCAYDAANARMLRTTSVTSRPARRGHATAGEMNVLDVL